MKTALLSLLILINSLLPITGQASFIEKLKFATAAEQEIQFLPEEQAFMLSAKQLEDNKLLFTWQMPKGYYLYRHGFRFDSAEASLGEPVLPEGLAQYDEYLGDYQIFHDQVSVTVPVLNSQQSTIAVQAHFQGCAASGYCYPPMTRPMLFTLDPVNHAVAKALPLSEAPPEQSTVPEQDRITQLLANKHLAISLMAFLGFGLLLAFTPCVLPMLPIVSSLVVGQKKHSTHLAFVLSGTYVLGVAMTYGIAGSLAGLAGNNIQTAFQQPWILTLTAVIFVALALSMFGYYELRLPHKLSHHLHNAHQRQQGGSLLSAFAMGILSALIVSPCVTAPLIGALAYISQTGDALLGGMALFCLGLGMGLPLIAFTTIGTEIMPKSGAWMEHVKHFFGILLLGLAVSLVSRFLPGPITLALWGTLGVCVGVYIGALKKPKSGFDTFCQGLGLVLIVVGACYLVGAAQGNHDPLAPLSRQPQAQLPALRSANSTSASVNSPSELQEALSLAQQRNQPVLLDFTAEWCLSCAIMERTVINTAEVQTLLKKFTVLKADITHNTADDKALMQSLGVFAPPDLRIL